MSFNVVGTLLAVGSSSETVHVFKLTGKGSGGGGGGNGNGGNGSVGGVPLSPSGSVDSREESKAMDGGYQGWIDSKKSKSVS